MKYILLFTLILATCAISNAQSQKNVFFDRDNMITKFHSVYELEELKKGDLIDLYTSRLKEIMITFPYLALTHQPEVSLSDVGIKEDSDNLKVLKKQHETLLDSFEPTSDMVTELVAYADTKKIINAILYFEEIIKKIRVGLDTSY